MTPPDSARFPEDSPRPPPAPGVVHARALSQRVATADGTLTILSDVALDVKAGETLAITGASGSGKSTLLGLLAGLDQPSAGEIHLLGQRLGDLDEDARARLRAGRVGFVFQSFQLLPALTALENVLLPLELAGRDDARARAVHWLDRVGLGARAGHTPRQLSGGEQQRVAIARALAPGPAILIADEPTGNLDQATGRQIADMLFAKASERGTSLVLVTHDPALAARCERQVAMRSGRIEPAAEAEKAAMA